MLLGYARVSTDGQDHALQLDALRQAGCDKLFIETASGTKACRAELARLLDTARAGDQIVVWRLDRLGRSLKHLIDLSEQLQQRGVGLRSLTEAIDTSTPAGRFLLTPARTACSKRRACPWCASACTATCRTTCYATRWWRACPCWGTT